ncbi:MAG: hypothetical protein ACRDC0_05965 [Aeromonas veronii]
MGLHSAPDLLLAIQEDKQVGAEQTPAAHWRQNGEADPFGKRYECERASLPLGNLTDDELANAVFMYGDSIPSAAELMNGVHMPITYLTAAKERIRWLSRQLELATTHGGEAE